MNHKSLTYTLEHRLRLNRKLSNGSIFKSLVLAIGLLGLCAPNQSEASQRASVPTNKTQFKTIVASPCEKWVSKKELLTCALYHESRSEFIKTKFRAPLAIGFVILNRSYYRNRTIKQVITRESQFSWYNSKQTRKVVLENKIDLDSWRAAKKIADVVLKIETFPRGVQEYLDPTKGADHFYHQSIDAPSWSKKMDLKANIGHFKFLKDS